MFRLIILLYAICRNIVLALPLLLRLSFFTYLGLLATLFFSYGSVVGRYALQPIDIVKTYLGMIEYWRAHHELLSMSYGINVIIPPLTGFLTGLFMPVLLWLLKRRRRRQKATFNNVHSTTATTIDGVYKVIDVDEPKV